MTTTSLTTTAPARTSRTTSAPRTVTPRTVTPKATGPTEVTPRATCPTSGVPTISVPFVAARPETTGTAPCACDEQACAGACDCGDAACAARPGGGRAPRPLADTARRRWGTMLAQGDDAGMATAEYAIAMIAAVGFAGLLVAVLTSATVRELLTGLVTSALSYG